MCCGGPQWKREVVPDHKFDFIDTHDFVDHGCWMRTRYLWIYVLVLKSFLVYVFDIFTAITMLTTDSWSNHIFDSCTENDDNGCVFVPFKLGKWLFVACIIASFLLLAYEARKARKIIASRDISYAFTNIMANNYYSLRSYDHFCFFSRINNSTKKTDDFAFFVFFTFKSWKRLLLADGPRQVINALTLYSFYLSQKKQPGSMWDLNKYTNGSIITGALIFSTLSTVAIFIGSALLLLAAGVCYIPLLCYIRGNLKEYCCHKVDKRISEIVKRKNKERLAQAAKLARKEAAGDFSHLKNKKGELVHNPLPQPTLPDIKLDDDELMDDSATARTRVPGANDYYYADYKNAYASDYPPPMPAYQQQYGAHAPSLHSTTDDPSGYYGDKYDSQINLTTAAAPIAHGTDNASPTHMTNPHSATHNGEFGYEGHNGGYGYDGYNHDGHAGYGQDVPGAYAVSGDPNEYGQHAQAHPNYGQGYGQGYEQDVGKAYAYGYEPQPDRLNTRTHVTNVPPRTASRSQNPQYDTSAYQQSRYNGGSGYDAHGYGGGGGGYAVG